MFGAFILLSSPQTNKLPKGAAETCISPRGSHLLPSMPSLDFTYLSLKFLTPSKTILLPFLKYVRCKARNCLTSGCDNVLSLRSRKGFYIILTAVSCRSLKFDILSPCTSASIKVLGVSTAR